MKKLNLKTLTTILNYVLFGLFQNIKWASLSFVNIIKILHKSNRYKMFSSQNALLYYFYDINLISLINEGRNKYSHHISNKPFLIGKWFHLSKISLYPFCKNSILTVFFSWLIILFYPAFSNFNELGIEMIVITVLTAFSSMFFNQLKLQNYNIVGWIFLYPYLEVITQNNPLLIFILSIILFETSITVFAIGSLFLISSCFFFEISFNTILLNFLLVSPFILRRVHPLIKAGIMKDQFSKILIAIGSIKEKKSILKRKPKTTNHIIFDLFNLLVLIIFSVLFLINGQVPLFLILSALVYFINIFISRFADPQSMHICIIICSVFSLFTLNQNIELIIFYWFFISNPVILALFKNKFDGKIEAPLYPVKISELEKALDNFYQHIEPNQNVFFPCEDPKGLYENILDKHNILLNPLAYFAVKNNILFFPYFFSIVDESKKSDELYWGTHSKDVLLNMKKGKFNYVLIQSESTLKNDTGFSNNFKVITKLNWKEIYPHPLKEIIDNPIWYLLKLEDNLKPSKNIN